MKVDKFAVIGALSILAFCLAIMPCYMYVTVHIIHACPFYYDISVALGLLPSLVFSAIMKDWVRS